MQLTAADLQSFHEFALGRISNGGSGLSVAELACEWQSLRERDEVHAAIRRGLADVEAGRHRPVEEFNEELRQKYKFGQQ